MGPSVLGRRSVLLMILNQRRLLLFPVPLFPPLFYRISRVHIHCYLCLLPVIGFPSSGRGCKKERERERHQCNHHFIHGWPKGFIIIIIYSNVWHLCFFTLFLLHCVCTAINYTCIFSGVLVSLHLVHRRMTHQNLCFWKRMRMFAILLEVV